MSIITLLFLLIYVSLLNLLFHTFIYITVRVSVIFATTIDVVVIDLWVYTTEKFIKYVHCIIDIFSKYRIVLQFIFTVVLQIIINIAYIFIFVVINIITKCLL